MIQLVDRGPDESLIRFSPRSKFRKLGQLEGELVHGHICQFCRNVIQAVFFTDTPVDIEKYEETRVLSQGEKNMGELLKVVPNYEDGGNYRSEFFETPNGNVQKITLKNHVINWAGVKSANREKDFFEVGERCCVYSSVIALQNETLIRDLAMVAGFDLVATQRYAKTDPPIDFILEWFRVTPDFTTKELRTTKAIGEAPPAILIPRKLLKDRFGYVVTMLYQAWDIEVTKQERDAVARLEEARFAEQLREDGKAAAEEYFDSPDEERI